MTNNSAGKRTKDGNTRPADTDYERPIKVRTMLGLWGIHGKVM